MSKPLEVSLSDYIKHISPHDLLDEEFAIFEINEAKNSGLSSISFPVRIDAYSILIVCKGEMSISVDYLAHHIKKDMVMEVLNHQIIDSVSHSPDLKGYHILISKDFLLDILKMIRHLLPPFPVRPRRLNPSNLLEERDLSLILDTIARVRRRMIQNDHFCLKGVIKNEMSLFLLDLVNAVVKKQDISKVQPYEITHKEEIMVGFVRLLVKHCKEKHEVSFYSTELCITPEYLSRVLKKYSGKTANKWIDHAIITEAKILLRSPEYTIQKVSELLSFSELSSFSKFFKKNTGQSPLDYKNSIKTKL